MEEQHAGQTDVKRLLESPIVQELLVAVESDGGVIRLNKEKGIGHFLRQLAAYVCNLSPEDWKMVGLEAQTYYNYLVAEINKRSSDVPLPDDMPPEKEEESVQHVRAEPPEQPKVPDALPVPMEPAEQGTLPLEGTSTEQATEGKEAGAAAEAPASVEAKLAPGKKSPRVYDTQKVREWVVLEPQLTKKAIMDRAKEQKLKIASSSIEVLYYEGRKTMEILAREGLLVGMEIGV